MNLIITPVVSEKAFAMAENGKYAFEVPMSANKQQVAAAIAERFKVGVEDVNMIVVKGKTKRFRRVLGRRNDRKKAIVTLKKGDSIKLFEGDK